jgi:hypothetical protein
LVASSTGGCRSRSRVEAVGGSIEIAIPPGEGTHLVVKLPLELDLTVDEFQDTLTARISTSR